MKLLEITTNLIIKKVNESSSDWISDIDDSTIKQAVRRAEIELLHDVPNGNYWTIGRVIQDLLASNVSNDIIKYLLTKHKKDIIEMQELLIVDGTTGTQAGLDNMVALIKIGIDWPELYKLIENNKHIILKTTLWDIRHTPSSLYAMPDVPILYQCLVKIGVTWPEMAIIKKSVDASKEMVD